VFPSKQKRDFAVDLVRVRLVQDREEVVLGAVLTLVGPADAWVQAGGDQPPKTDVPAQPRIPGERTALVPVREVRQVVLVVTGPAGYVRDVLPAPDRIPVVSGVAKADGVAEATVDMHLRSDGDADVERCVEEVDLVKVVELVDLVGGETLGQILMLLAEGRDRDDDEGGEGGEGALHGVTS
jgi:hypothetical protein